MAQNEEHTPETPTVPAQRKSATESRTSIRSSLFKYYIHDGVDSCRIQLLGELSQTEVLELNGCWNTAKTTLGTRKLLLDLRDLKMTDESGRQWIISMANDGAVLLPETFLRDGLAAHSPPPDTSSVGLFSRILTLFRGSRAIPAQSSTQAQ